MCDTLYKCTKHSVFCHLVLAHSHTYRHSHLGDLNNFCVHFPIELIRRRGTDYNTLSIWKIKELYRRLQIELEFLRGVGVASKI